MKLVYVVSGAAVFGGLAIAIIACGKSSSDGSGTCQSYYNAATSFFTACAPTDQAAAGDQARFSQYCQDLENAPGSAADKSLSACTSALNTATSTCGSVGKSICASQPGSLANDAACGDDSQCQSAFCNIATTTITIQKDGGASETLTVPTTGCGKCAAPIATGQPCSDATTSRCAGADGLGYCKGATTSTMGVCDVTVINGVGGACGTPGGTCASNLRCDPASMKCAGRGETAATCSIDSDCVFPLVCSNGLCATGQAQGAACSTKINCLTQLACDLATSTCVTPTLADPGAACDGAAIVCKKGFCDETITQSPDGGIIITGTCPAILADGTACDPGSTTSQCDQFSTCINQLCTFVDPSTCK